MSISLSEYKKTKVPNIYVSKNHTNKFLFRKRSSDGRRATKVVEIAVREKWTGREYLQEAMAVFAEWAKGKDMAASNVSRIQPNIKVKQLWNLYMETRAKTKATTGLAAMFNNHIKNSPLGSLAIEKVTLDHIQIFYNSMRSKGLSPKTYNKTIKEILRPMFKYALIHRALAFEPTFGLKLDKIEKKSKVINCSNKLRNLFSAINELYADDVFYWTLFALIFTGRRKSEILNLKWKNINFSNNTMLLERTKNSNDYIVAIPNFIASKLQEIPRIAELVFASPVSGETIVNLDRQVKKIRELSGVENFHLHMVRDIVVGALAEASADIHTMSGTLLHEELATLQHYLGVDTYKATQKSSQVIENLVATKRLGQK